MRIGIDAHAIGARQGGNETYITNLIKSLAEIDGDNFGLGSDVSFRLFVGQGQINAGNDCARGVMHRAAQSALIALPLSGHSRNGNDQQEATNHLKNMLGMLSS